MSKRHHQYHATQSEIDDKSYITSIQRAFAGKLTNILNRYPNASSLYPMVMSETDAKALKNMFDRINELSSYKIISREKPGDETNGFKLYAFQRKIICISKKFSNLEDLQGRKLALSKTYEELMQSGLIKIEQCI